MSTYTDTELDVMARHYVIAAIWADCEEGTHPRATREALRIARVRCARFLALIGPDLLASVRERPEYGAHPDCGNVAAVFAAMGHDLYLTSAGGAK